MRLPRIETSRLLLSSALDAAEIGVIIVNRDAEIVAFNDWMSRASVISLNQALGARVETLFPELAGSRICTGIDSALRRGVSSVLSPYFARVRFPLRDTTASLSGGCHPFMQQKISIKPVVGDGDVAHCVIQVQDMSDAMRRESLLRDEAVNNKRMMSLHQVSEARMRAILDGAFDAIIMLDEERCIESFNRAASAIFGYEANEITGREIDLILPETMRAAGDDSEEDVSERLRAGEGVILQTTGRCRDAREFVAEVTLKAAQAGDEQKVVATVRDISARKATEQDLKDFVYVVSHDLQSPLHTVLSFAKRLRKHSDGKLDEKGEKAIGYVIGGAERMLDLIRSLADYSRIETRGQVLEPVFLGEHVDSAVENLRSAIEESESQVSVGEMPPVLGDATQLVQLVQNLVGNALKFCGESRPQVHVAARRCGELWEITVKDNGIGIDSDSLERVFQVFQRLHTQEEYPGTGIGLSVCKKIVERHGGRIWAESQPGMGTTFHFTLQATDGCISDNPAKQRDQKYT